MRLLTQVNRQSVGYLTPPPPLQHPFFPLPTLIPSPRLTHVSFIDFFFLLVSWFWDFVGLPMKLVAGCLGQTHPSREMLRGSITSRHVLAVWRGQRTATAVCPYHEFVLFGNLDTHPSRKTLRFRIASGHLLAVWRGQITYLGPVLFGNPDTHPSRETLRGRTVSGLLHAVWRGQRTATAGGP